jgi:hypothetical protein
MADRGVGDSLRAGGEDSARLGVGVSGGPVGLPLEEGETGRKRPVFIRRSLRRGRRLVRSSFPARTCAPGVRPPSSGTRGRGVQARPRRPLDYLLVEWMGLPEPLPGAERLGRRTALTFPLLPPPQKN